MKKSAYSVDRIKVDGVEVYVLRDSTTQAEAKIAPSLGNNCYRFGLPVDGESIDVLDPPPDLDTLRNRPTAYGNPILFPFPNRIREGKFTFEGKVYTFDKRPDAVHSIHGLLLNQSYRVESTRADAVDGASIVCRLDSRQFPEILRQYPFPFEMLITYVLKGCILTMGVNAKNIGDVNMPMGFGIHPYFRAPLSSKSSAEKCLITVPASKYWELDHTLVPTGRIFNVEADDDARSGKPFAGMQFDNVFTDVTLSEGVSQCIIDDQDAHLRMILEADTQFRELVVYTPPNRSSICFEPYTCPTDAINLEAKGIKAGVIVLKPGEVFSGLIRIIADLKTANHARN